MSVVSQITLGAKVSHVTPLQAMLITTVWISSLAVQENLRSALQDRFNKLLNTTVQFIATAPTPEGMYLFECRLADLLHQMGLSLVECAMNNLEPEQAAEMPPRVRCGTAEFSRRGRKTNHRGGVACLFGTLDFMRWSYEPLSEESESGLKSIAPLVAQLGLVADKATPALAEAIGRLSQERSESSVGECLWREHHVSLAAETVCSIRDAVAQGISKHMEDELVRTLLDAIQTGGTQGKVILAVGRDGIFLPMRGGVTNDRFKEAAVATISVYVKPPGAEKNRLCTIYLGQMPQPGQEELTDRLTAVLQRVLSGTSAQDLQLVYLTDAGHHPQEYFKNVLQNMDNPQRPGKKLEWKWIVDYYHASLRLSTLANLIFNHKGAADDWVKKMRHTLKHESNAIHRILHSAAALKPKSLSGKMLKEYEDAYNYTSRGRDCRNHNTVCSFEPRQFPPSAVYLLKYREAMNYATYRAQSLPIGSGVTEAACKTVFTQRFKCSGMLWSRNNDYDHRDPEATLSRGRAVLTLRLAVLSRIYSTVFQKSLATKTATARLIVTNLQLSS